MRGGVCEVEGGDVIIVYPGREICGDLCQVRWIMYLTGYSDILPSN
jgi:hypothetical protein